MAWLSGYLYRKSITIAAQSGAGTNYQVKLLIGKASGATGENLDLGGHCLDTMVDMRFTASDGTTALDYWIESVAASGTSYLATVWVEVAADLSSTNQTIYIYYGDADGTDGSSGANTFLNFDNFEATPGGTGWTDVDTAVDFDNTEQYWGGARSAKQVGNNAYYSTMYRSETIADNKAVMWRFRYNDNGGLQNFQWSNASKRVLIRETKNDGKIYWNDGSDHDSGYTTAINTWVAFEIRNINLTGNTYDLVVNGNVVNANIRADAGTNGVLLFTGSGYTAKDDWIDNVIVRKFVATEPAYSSAGSEESASSVKSVNGLARASVKSKNGLAIASIKSWNSLA